MSRKHFWIIVYAIGRMVPEIGAENAYKVAEEFKSTFSRLYPNFDCGKFDSAVADVVGKTHV